MIGKINRIYDVFVRYDWYNYRGHYIRTNDHNAHMVRVDGIITVDIYAFGVRVDGNFYKIPPTADKSFCFNV